MIALFGVVFCYAATNLITKLVQHKGWPLKSLALLNYVTVFFFCLALTAANGTLAAFRSFSCADAMAGIGTFDHTANDSTALLIAMLLGAATGVIFLVTYLGSQRNVVRYGASLTSMYSGVAFVIAILASIFLWNEMPKPYQWIGIAGVAVAIVLTSYNGKRFRVNISLLLLLLAQGVCQLLMKAYAEYGRNEFAQAYYLSAYVVCVAFLAGRAAWYRARRGERFALNLPIVLCGLVQGCVIGVFGVVQQAALVAFPAGVVYPTQGAGGMAVVAVVSMLAFREKLNRYQIAALLLSMACLVIVNL